MGWYKVSGHPVDRGCRHAGIVLYKVRQFCDVLLEYTNFQKPDLLVFLQYLLSHYCYKRASSIDFTPSEKLLAKKQFNNYSD